MAESEDGSRGTSQGESAVFREEDTVLDLTIVMRL